MAANLLFDVVRFLQRGELSGVRARGKKAAGSTGGNAVAEACDASSGEAVLALAERVRQKYGIRHVIVNCAATKYIRCGRLAQ